MSAPHPFQSSELQRLRRWILLWLKWFTAFLATAGEFAPFTQQAERVAHSWLDHIERGLLSVIILRAFASIRTLQPPRHSSRRRKQRQHWRALIGSSLRRALRGRTLAERIAALSQNLEPLVARFIKRIPRGLTRRRPFIARPESRTPAHASATALPACTADTS
ncbi:MAG: hypothetical protein QM759_13575 [Terricaulis sp.]